MLSIGRITAGAGYEYLTRDVATSRHDYYAGAGEQPGVWWGDGLSRLGLAGEVTEEQMAALYGHALDPTTGEPLGRRFPAFKPSEKRLAEAVEAFTSEHGHAPTGDGLAALQTQVDQAPRREAIAALDITFSPVKTVSTLWALGDDHTRSEIEDAHDAAIDAALRHLQDVAGTTRAGTNGVRTIDSDGWIVARFTHRMSRAHDPQLHTRCAVLNRVHCADDGRWRTLDSRAIYRLSTGGGGMYTRALEDELTRRLGVSWRDVDPDGPTPRRELAGVPRDLTREWSKRRAQVEDALADLDEAPRTPAARAAAAQQATLRTRPAKHHTDTSPRARWHREAEALGIDPARLVDIVAPGPAVGAGACADIDAVSAPGPDAPAAPAASDAAAGAASMPAGHARTADPPTEAGHEPTEPADPAAGAAAGNAGTAVDADSPAGTDTTADRHDPTGTPVHPAANRHEVAANPAGHAASPSASAASGHGPGPGPGGPAEDAQTDGGPAALDVDEVLDRAVARLEENQATWRRGNLVRAVAEALPPAPRTATETSELVERLVDDAERSGRLVAIAAPEPVPVPAELRRRDDTSVYRPAAATRYTTPGILAAEARIVAAAQATDAGLAVPAPAVDAVLADGTHGGMAYGPDQAAAVRAVCGSGRRLEVLIGPAGAGKTTTMRGLAESWSATGGRVIGLAVAQTAADILAAGADIPAHNIARWLFQNGNRPDDPRWQLRAGDLVIVDEVGMVSTRQLDQLRARADAAGAKLLGVGDPLQLGPVGAGGAARLVADDVGATYLHEVHRFTHQWEAEATLAIRAGDETAAGVYDSHGRLHGGDRDQALAGARAAWLADHLAGRDALLLAVSIDQVVELAGWCRDQLVTGGHVDDTTTVTLHDANRAGSGDLVVTRRNDRTSGVANRDVWHLDAVAADGSLALRHTRDGRSTVVTADYAHEHVELAYATTVHASQGRTADAAHLVAGTGLDRELLYVGMTRGRSDNHAWVVTEDFLHDELGGGTIAPADAIRAIVAQEPAVVSATEALRTELGSADSLAVLGPIHEDLTATVARRRALSYLAHRYGPATRHGVDADAASAALVALLRRGPTAGTDPDRLLAHACRGDLGGAQSSAQVLAARTRRILEQLEDGTLSAGQLAPLPAEWSPPDAAIERYHHEIGELIDQRTRRLGELTEGDPPAWATERWGPVPANPVARATWITAAGKIAAYRERWATDADPDDLAANPPTPRAVKQRLDHQELLPWLDINPDHLAGATSDTPNADGSQPTSDHAASSVDDELDTALASINAARTAIDHRPREPDTAVPYAEAQMPVDGSDIDVGL